MNRIKDPYTGKYFFPKRRNQKFENRNNQINYNNLNAREDRKLTATFKTILSRNRRILKWLLGPRSCIIVRRERLVSQGYDFKFHTHQMLVGTVNKIKVDCVFEFAIFRLINENFKVYRY
jgi:hypothetical protein